MPTFNREASLRAFSKFQNLDDHIQSIILQMLKDDRLNSYGGLKRPPNAWLIFRSDMLAANPEMSTMSQAEVTVRCKSRWAVTTLQERMELQARARQANDELLQYFPDYSYKPMSTGEKEQWKELGSYQRKDFWLSSAERIAERIADSSRPWNGFLTLDKWAEDTPTGLCGTSKSSPLACIDSAHPLETECTSESLSPPPIHLAPRVQRLRSKPTRGSIDPPDSTTDQLGINPARFHPYNQKPATQVSPPREQERGQSRIRRKINKKFPLPAFLRDVLIPIGWQTSSTQRRRLVLSMFQLKDKMVWVSEEVDDDVPDDVYEKLSCSVNPDKTSPDHLVLRDYTDPWIPEAMNKDGELFHPEIGSVSEYHDYMAAYYFAKENDWDFIWPSPPRSPSLSPPSLHEAPVDETITSMRPTEPASSDSQSPLVDPTFDLNTEASPPEMCEPLPSTNLISDSDSDSVTTPEEDLGWDIDDSMLIDIVEGFDHEELEDSEFNFE